MSGVRLMQNVIETRIECRGDGTKENPNRIITQYWDEHGNWLADNDPLAGTAPTGSKSDG